jgi:uncharacterized protein YkwD
VVFAEHSRAYRTGARQSPTDKEPVRKHAHAHAGTADIKPAGGRTWTRLGGVVATSALAAAALLSAAAPAEAAGSPSQAELRASVVKLTNKARVAKGCKPLKRSPKLHKAAQRHARDMSAKDYFSHTSANGRAWHTRIRAAGYTKPGGENIAYGFRTPAGVMKGWMNSPGHRRNILDCNFKRIGIGYTADGRYWVQDFGY